MASNGLLLDTINSTIFPNREIDRSSPKVWLEISGLGDPTIDRLSDKLIGATITATITAAEVTDSCSRMELTQGDIRHVLELSNDPRPSAVTLSGKPRRWNPKESHLDALVVSRSGYLWLRRYERALIWKGDLLSMTLRKQGKYSYGENHRDIRDELRDYSRHIYPATKFADAVCRCGAGYFHVKRDEEVGAAVRVCQSCGLEQAIADSAEYLSDAELESCDCVCGSDTFELSVGAALYDESTDVKWLYLGLRCTDCGMVGCYGDWKNEFIGYEDLLLRV